MKIAIGSDHGGFSLKEIIKRELTRLGHVPVDHGCFSTEASDYPDYCVKVCRSIIDKEADEGILICTTGIGMSMAANKFPHIRAALCTSVAVAKSSRLHNDANVLVMGASTITTDVAIQILEAWFGNKFSREDRHVRRVVKVNTCAMDFDEVDSVYDSDRALYSAIHNEIERQKTGINLIASENYVTRSVRQAQGSVMTNKYAEGYPGKRWYNGCTHVDNAESLAIDRAMKLFGAEHANVQPHCGSSANMAVYFAVLQPGDNILAMSLAHGGHLTHGNPVNFSGRLFNISSYGVRSDTECIDYDELQKIAKTVKPKMIVAGASAYPRILDFKRFRQIADEVGAMLTVDMAHIAGLVAGGVHPSPVPYADFVTSTTHKTLRGPRGGLILCKAKYAADIDKQIFPGIQGGPLMHTIAAKAVCFHEALQKDFTEYSKQTVKNAKVMADCFVKDGIRIVSGGTENHLMLLDLTGIGVTGKDAALALDRAGIIVNKNAIPFDQKSPFVTSGIRIGTPAVTTRGMKEGDMIKIAGFVTRVLKNQDNDKVINEVLLQVREMTAGFAVP